MHSCDLLQYLKLCITRKQSFKKVADSKNVSAKPKKTRKRPLDEICIDEASSESEMGTRKRRKSARIRGIVCIKFQFCECLQFVLYLT